jgi:glycosyltransferase involved in cell wall biosynthesis
MLRLGSRITWLPIIYDSGVASQIGEIAPEILQCVRDAELVFYIPSRQEAFKRQDKALRAFKTFLETRKERVILIIARWGDLAAERQREVVSLGLEKHVVWVNCLPKAELMALLRLPNLVVLDEFEDDPYIMSFGGVARDAMAAGAAVISRVSMEYIRLLHRTLPPTLFTDEKEESILARMCEYADMTPSQRVEHGLRARAWLDEEHAPAQLVPRYLALYA